MPTFHADHEYRDDFRTILRQKTTKWLAIVVGCISHDLASLFSFSLVSSSVVRPILFLSVVIHYTSRVGKGFNVIGLHGYLVTTLLSHAFTVSGTG